MHSASCLRDDVSVSLAPGACVASDTLFERRRVFLLGCFSLVLALPWPRLYSNLESVAERLFRCPRFKAVRRPQRCNRLRDTRCILKDFPYCSVTPKGFNWKPTEKHVRQANVTCLLCAVSFPRRSLSEPGGLLLLSNVHLLS